MTGALLLCYLRPFGVAALLYGFLAITESALQKLLTLFLFFGKPLFEAVDLFFADVLENFGVQSAVSWAWVVVYTYVGFYALWGLMLGYWIPRLPGQLQRRTTTFADLDLKTKDSDAAPKQKSRRKGIMLLTVLLFIVLTFLLAGGKASGGQKALYAVLRTMAVLAAWFFIVQPFVSYLFKQWAAKRSKEERGALQQIVDFMPDLRARALPLYRHVAQHHSGWRRWLGQCSCPIIQLWSGMVTTICAALSKMTHWQPRRLSTRGLTARSIKSSSLSEISSKNDSPLSTYTWQVEHAHTPPQLWLR
jgi:hypothetical protein